MDFWKIKQFTDIRDLNTHRCIVHHVDTLENDIFGIISQKIQYVLDLSFVGQSS